MDYSTLPTALIYQQKTLDKISELHELNRIVLNNLLDIETLHDVDFEKFALPCFNNAYYICTMMRMERNAEYRRNSYKKIALNGKEKNTLVQCVTLSLVAILNEHCSLAWRQKLHAVNNELKHYAKSLWLERKSEVFFPLSSPDDTPDYNNEMVHLIGMPEAMSRGIDETIVLPEELFAPRHIDEKTLRDMDRENHHFEWANWTNYYDEDIVRELVEGLGTTQQDKAMLIRSLMEKSDSFYLNDYPKQHVEPLLKSLAEELCPDCLKITNLYSDESLGTTTTDIFIPSHQDNSIVSQVTNSEQQSIIEQQATRIKELEEQVIQLQKEISQISEIYDEHKNYIPEQAFTASGSECFTKAKMGLLIYTIASLTDGPTPTKNQLVPIISAIGGWEVTSVNSEMKKAGFNQKDIDTVAKVFESAMPKFASEIKKQISRRPKKKVAHYLGDY